MAGSETTMPAPRIPLDMDVRYRRSYARQEDRGQLKNISLTGAFLKVNDPSLLERDKIMIDLNVSGRNRKLSATVVWRNQYGCGVQFNPFNNRDVQIVDDLIYFVESNRENRRSVLENIFKRVS